MTRPVQADGKPVKQAQRELAALIWEVAQQVAQDQGDGGTASP